MHHTAALLDHDNIGHGFFGRSGGVSTGIYASLNCGLGSQDNPDAIAENRRRAVRAIANEDYPLVTAYQVHSNVVATVAAQDVSAAARPQADAMVTRARHVALGILTADCCPVLFADAENGVIGAAHAGWRGALSGIIPNTLRAMQDIGAHLGHIRAAIGPTIQQSSYEVGTDVRDAFINADTGSAKFFIPSRAETKWMFDLPGFVAATLLDAGVQLYENLGMDTYPPANDFFSYRRRTHDIQNGQANTANDGRQIAVIALR